MVKPRAVVIDVGINRITDGEGNSRLVGMSTLNLFKVWRNFSPGSWRGPMTVAMLLQNTVLSYSQRHPDVQRPVKLLRT